MQTCAASIIANSAALPSCAFGRKRVRSGWMFLLTSFVRWLDEHMLWSAFEPKRIP